MIKDFYSMTSLSSFLVFSSSCFSLLSYSDLSLLSALVFSSSFFT